MDPFKFIASYANKIPAAHNVTTWCQGEDGYSLRWEILTNNLSSYLMLIDDMKKTEFWKKCWYSSDWSGKFVFHVNPVDWGYMKVKDYCKKYDVSRQYVHKIKDKFDWIEISTNINYIKPFTYHEEKTEWKFIYLVVDRVSKNVINGYEDQQDAIDYIDENDANKYYTINSCSLYNKKKKHA